MAQYELNVIDYWLIVKKRKYLIVLATALVVGFTVVFSQLLQPPPKPLKLQSFQFLRHVSSFVRLPAEATSYLPPDDQRRRRSKGLPILNSRPGRLSPGFGF